MTLAWKSLLSKLQHLKCALPGKVVDAAIIIDAWLKGGRESRRLLAGCLAEGEGECEREGEEVNARPWLH
jgi:hypothetical protein